ncbi:MAG: TetR/AcrR family transcriptional regulator [Nocardioides sp.]|uniref:TetR/AcrR family transcriptional regulator n=1 Tax=Nocardioides sp. TaxID=35761 RepID=UPI0039E50AA7
MSTSSRPPVRAGYHHGDLRATLLAAAMQMLEEGASFSLRGLARRAGVSQTAPYRHFADREALESALATQGLADLRAELVGDGGPPTTMEGLVGFAVVYVDFALRRPALFRLMFGNECSAGGDPLVAAAQELDQLLIVALENVFPDSDVQALATACWSLVHGLAFLHLAGKLDAADPGVTAERVRASFEAILTASGRVASRR